MELEGEAREGERGKFSGCDGGKEEEQGSPPSGRRLEGRVNAK